MKFMRFLFATILCGALAGCSERISDADAAKVAALAAELTQLESAVVESEDISAIKRLTRAYGYYLDKGLWEELAELFSDDAVADYPSGVFVGKDSIRSHYVQNLGAGKTGLGEGELADHLMLQPIVHVDAGGQRAHGRWRALEMTGRFGQSAHWSEGPYEIEYVKNNGVWKIKTLTYYQTFTSPYENGAWGKKVLAVNPGAQLAHRPDRPRDDQACPRYPSPCLPPFHYKNPVSGR